MKSYSYFFLFILMIFGGCISEKNDAATVTISPKKLIFKEVRPPYSSISPLFSAMQKLKGQKLKDSIDYLLDLGKKRNFPLVEVDSLYKDYVYVTFIYQDSTHKSDISFEIFGNSEDYHLDNNDLNRLNKSDIYFRTYMMPNDICFAYKYVLEDKASKNITKIIDPLNIERIPKGVQKKVSWSVLDLAPSSEDWNSARYPDTKSRIDTLQFSSNILGNSRKIYVYLPEEYDSKKKYPVIYLLDANIYLNRVEVPNILDNMIRENKIAPMIAVLVDNADDKSRYSELPLNPLFKDFMVSELIPNLRKNYSVSEKKEENIIGGMSYGGLAATYIAFYHDDVFGKVLSHSGSLWRDKISDLNYSDMQRNDWLINEFSTKSKKDLKIYLDWGLQENKVFGSNRKFTRILNKLNYDFLHYEFNGWHDWSNSRKTFPDALIYLTESK